MIRKNKKNSGFGIIEVLIASLMLITVVGAVVALGSSSVRGGLTASDKSTAYNLVQECLENARAARDTAYKDPSVLSWDAKIIDPNFARNTCSTPVNIGTPTVTYNRTVIVSDVPNASIAATPSPIMKKITVTVGWDSESGPKTISASEYLTDWKQIN